MLLKILPLKKYENSYKNITDKGWFLQPPKLIKLEPTTDIFLKILQKIWNDNCEGL